MNSAEKIFRPTYEPFEHTGYPRGNVIQAWFLENWDTV